MTVPETRPRLADSDPAGCVADAIPRADATIHVSIVVKMPPYQQAYSRAEMYPEYEHGRHQKGKSTGRRRSVHPLPDDSSGNPVPLLGLRRTRLRMLLRTRSPPRELPQQDKSQVEIIG